MTALAGRSQLQALSKDHGAAGSLLIVGVCLSAVLAFLASAVLIDWFAVARRAEQAAELAALAAISAELRGESGCLAAASTALTWNRSPVTVTFMWWAETASSSMRRSLSAARPTVNVVFCSKSRRSMVARYDVGSP